MSKSLHNLLLFLCLYWYVSTLCVAFFLYFVCSASYRFPFPLPVCTCVCLSVVSQKREARRKPYSVPPLQMAFTPPLLLACSSRLSCRAPSSPICSLLFPRALRKGVGAPEVIDAHERMRAHVYACTHTHTPKTPLTHTNNNRQTSLFH